MVKEILMKRLILICAVSILVLGHSVHANTSFYELERLYQNNTRHLSEFKLAHQYFDIYMNNDLGRAKALYLYLTQRISQIEENIEQSESALVNLEASNIAKGTALFDRTVDVYLSLQSIYMSIENSLRADYATIDQLKESAMLIETARPLIEIIEGRLDSDYDGVPDNVELGGTNESPFTGQTSPYH
jgi:hypothetical protein